MPGPERPAGGRTAPWMPMTVETPPHVWVYFELTGVPFDPDYVAAQLGVRPTPARCPGDAAVAGNGRRVCDTWRVAVGPLDALEISAMLCELMAIITPTQQRLRTVRDELHLDATITCTVEPTSTQMPEIRFPRDVIHWAAEHDVAIAVELAAPRS
jgi:hypothetical protein